MKIDDIIPYERNARHNEKAIPAVADSIREFGLKGQIVLESREKPVIVAGHTRWAACKSLGWTEIPDERIDFCDDLTEDQIKAFRIADNKTGDIATYNKTLLQHEVRSIKSVDMSRFNCDFKSKQLPYGAERLKTDRSYNLDLVNASMCNEAGMPVLEAVDARPDHMVGFNYAKTTQDTAACIHFFVDDYQFERCWSQPMKYVELLKKFDSVLTPDFSMYLDMPLPMQRWNTYRSRAFGYLCQKAGIEVIPTLSWAYETSYEFCFDGLEPGGTYAVSTVGVKRDENAVAIWFAGMEEAMKRLKPARILQYGGDLGFDYGDCEVEKYSNSVTERMTNGR